jgi:hypothetical protein
VEKAGDVLKQLIDSKQRQNAAHYSSLFKGWESMVGSPLDRHSWVKDIVNNILMVEVDHPGWMQMLFFNKRKVLTRLRQTYPELAIKDMSIRLGDERGKRGSVEPLPATPSSEDTVAAEDPEIAASIEDAVGKVEEEELKNGLRKLFISAVKRSRKAGEKKGGG